MGFRNWGIAKPFLINVPSSLDTSVPAFRRGKAKAKKDGWPQGFQFFSSMSLNNGVPVEGCMSSSADEGVAICRCLCGIHWLNTVGELV